jgi:hypothetical protein
MVRFRNAVIACCLSAALIGLVAAPAPAQTSSVQATLMANAIQSGMAAAKSPEEAAKLFAQVSTPIIASAAAEILKQVLEQSLASPSAAANAEAIKGWQTLVIQNGLELAFKWPTPGILPVSTLRAERVTSSTSSSAAPAAAGGMRPLGGNWSVGINVGGSF